MALQKKPVELTGAQITLLIPLVARAQETRKKNGMINDPLALKIIDSLDYDFENWRKSFGLSAAVFRTRIFDQLVEAFLAQHPSGTVVEIGAGLNDRFSRVDNGKVRWFDLDFPEVIKMRSDYIVDSERQTMIASSALDTRWFDEVKASQEPVCFVAEASIIYIGNQEVELLIKQLAENFKHGLLITDTTSATMVEEQGTHPMMRHLPKSSWFRWVCDDPAELERLGVRLLKSSTFFDANKDLFKQLPFMMRAIVFLAPAWARRKNEGYRVNVFEFP